MTGDDGMAVDPGAALAVCAGLQDGVPASGGCCTCCGREQYTGDRVVLAAARVVRATTPAGEPVTVLADCDLVATHPPTEGQTAAPG